MKKIILTIIYILTLSGCGLEQDSYLVRWWNGNIPTELSDKEKKIRDICFEETKLLRVKNEQYCDRLTNPLFYNKKSKYGDDYRVNMSDIFVHCMRVNGTPLYKDIPKKYEWLTDEDVRIK